MAAQELPRVLITGVGGFVGSHMAEHCLRQGCQVWGVHRGTAELSSLLAAKIQLVQGDLRDSAFFRRLVDQVRPHFVFHLAGWVSVPDAWKDPFALLSNNAQIDVNVLEALRDSQARLLLPCSSEEYGGSAGDNALDESTPLAPRNPYALSKVNQDMLGEQYARAYGMYIVRTRAFNHFGPRLAPGSALANFARQLARIERGEQEPVVKVGNLAARRDYTDVRDIVRAYWLALQGGCQAGEVYNVGSDQCRSMGELLDLLLSLSSVAVKIEVDPARMRPLDTPVMRGNSQRFRAATGWAPLIEIRTSLQDMLAECRGESVP